MACPICGRVYCDCSAEERGQSFEEMIADANRGLPVTKPPTKRKARKRGKTPVAK